MGLTVYWRQQGNQPKNLKTDQYKFLSNRQKILQKNFSLSDPHTHGTILSNLSYTYFMSQKEKREEMRQEKIFEKVMG